jgi:hypothetical protein
LRPFVQVDGDKVTPAVDTFGQVENEKMRFGEIVGARVVA